MIMGMVQQQQQQEAAKKQAAAAAARGGQQAPAPVQAYNFGGVPNQNQNADSFTPGAMKQKTMQAQPGSIMSRFQASGGPAEADPNDPLYLNWLRNKQLGFNMG